MTMSPETAMRQASATANNYALQAINDLCEILKIDKETEPNWREQLAKFDATLAAMIAAASADYDTASRAGHIDIAAYFASR